MFLLARVQHFQPLCQSRFIPSEHIIGTSERKTVSESSWKKFTVAFVMPSLAAIDLYADAFLEECKFEIIYVGHLPQMVHDIGFIVNH